MMIIIISIIAGRPSSKKSDGQQGEGAAWQCPGISDDGDDNYDDNDDGGGDENPRPINTFNDTDDVCTFSRTWSYGPFTEKDWRRGDQDCPRILSDPDKQGNSANAGELGETVDWK